MRRALLSISLLDHAEATLSCRGWHKHMDLTCAIDCTVIVQAVIEEERDRRAERAECYCTAHYCKAVSTY